MDEKIVVVGAGLAGLSAVDTLLEGEFIDKVLTYQTTGVLGFTDENRKYYDILQFTKQKNITITHDSNTTLVVINSESEEDMINNWKVVESLVKNIIGL